MSPCVPWSKAPSWRGSYDSVGTWISEWPDGLCKECGARFDGPPSRRYCGDPCRKRSHSRSGNHNTRIRKLAQKVGRVRPKYEIVGKFELLDAWSHRCGICGQTIVFDEAWCFGHITPIVDGGSHVRGNLGPHHLKCELMWHQEHPGGGGSASLTGRISSLATACSAFYEVVR